jgi:uncharacterized damage-inducible protein DinB
MSEMIKDFRDYFLRYRRIAEKALEQVSDKGLNLIPVRDGNSIAMLVRHISGNLISRFTDFLTSDGEKSWRQRDSEFETREYTRKEVEEHWQRCWPVLDQALDSLTAADLSKTVSIRGKALTVHEALLQAAAHVAHHVGQIVLLARIGSEGEWKWISIPKRMSQPNNPQTSSAKKPVP